MPATFNVKAFRTLADAVGDTTLSQIRARTGLDKGSLSRILRGETQPTLDTTATIADAYGSPVDPLIMRDAA